MASWLLGSLLLAIIALITCLIHELGHYIVAKVLRLDPKFIWRGTHPGVRCRKVYSVSTHICVGLAGIIAGLIILIYMMYLFRNTYDYIVILIMTTGYALSCGSDIRNIVNPFIKMRNNKN